MRVPTVRETERMEKGQNMLLKTPTIGLALCLGVAACSRAPVLVGLADVTPTADTLAGQLGHAQTLNLQARRLARTLAPPTWRQAVPALHTTLHRQHQVLTAAQSSVAQLSRLLQQNQTAAAAMQSALAAGQAKITALQAAVQAARTARDQARQRYQNAWLGGKMHRLINWIIGLGLLLLVLDFLASVFLGVGFNPLEWLFGLARLAPAAHS